MKLPVLSLSLLGLVLSAVLVPAHAAEGILKKATFCHGFTEKNTPKDTAEFFRPDETVYLSVELKGRPRSGVVTAKFLMRGEELTEAQVDVATANEGVIFSFGENTFVCFNITHKQPLPVGDIYVADVSFDGKPLGKFPFKVAPPEGAIPNKLLELTMAKGRDEDLKPLDETREFSRAEKVFLVGTADLGLSSWLEASWMIDGKEDEAGTRSITMKENKEKTPFAFSYVPEGGWPAGTHEVVLQLDGQEIAREKFTVKAGPPMAAAAKLAVQSSHLFKDDGNGEAGKEVKAFTTQDTVLHVRWDLKGEALAKGIQLAWVMVEVEGEEEQLLVTADVESAMSDNITSSLTAQKGLPPGKYRVDLLQDGKVLDSKPFQVKEARP